MSQETLSLYLPYIVCLMGLNVAPQQTASKNAPKQTPSKKTVPTPAKHFETRCGWFWNNTPANAELFDREGEWIIGVQGGYQAKGDWPPFTDKQWVETNGHYGYGCASLRCIVDRKTRHVIEIKSAKGLPLSACEEDKALKKALKRWGYK